MIKAIWWLFVFADSWGEQLVSDSVTQAESKG